MSVCWRRGGALLLPASVVLALFTAPSTAHAEPIGPRAAVKAPSTLFGFGASAVEPVKSELAGIDEQLGVSDVTLEKLETIADYHPETDRWTDRNNRIKISLFPFAWWPSGNLRVRQDVGAGLRVSWEVPGFIAVRFDAATVPWSRLKVHVPNPQFAGGADSTRTIGGSISNVSLSLAIFNPELSTPLGPLAFWAGFTIPPFSLWFYNYDDTIFVGSNVPQNVSYNDINLAGYIFVEFDLKIMDIFHVGIGYRSHFIYAPQTKDGAFYEINGNQVDKGDRSNPFKIATVQEFSLSFSVLF